MNPHTHKLLTIVTEAALEGVLAEKIGQLGATGYTVTDARGKGHRGIRNARWDASSNIRIEVVCSEATADAIVEHLRARYTQHYAMTMFVTDVAVVRPEEF